jgi:peptidoglycan/LPS O-acetylase OafA/YrhL
MEVPSGLGRNFGLDVVRATAILLVLVSHLFLNFNGLLNPSPFAQVTGYLGVELFFVLSGFLIGRVLLASVLPAPAMHRVLDFWIRRWLRTLPAYYAVITAILLISAIGVLPYVVDWRLMSFYVFAQNLFTRDVWEEFFGVGWSLVIEEWFYLLAPLLLIVARRVFRGRDENVAMTICGMLIVGPLVLRLVLALTTDMDWWTIRKCILPRFDAIAFGTLIAVLAAFRPSAIAAAQRHAKWCTLVALVGTIAISVALESGQAIVDSMAMKTLGLAVAPACFALVLPAFLLVDGRAFPARFVRGVTFISITSYAVYLVHWDIMQAVRSVDLGPTNYAIACGRIIVSVLLVFPAAVALNRTVEVPFLKLRERIAIPESRSLINPAMDL